MRSRWPLTTWALAFACLLAVGYVQTFVWTNGELRMANFESGGR